MKRQLLAPLLLVGLMGGGSVPVSAQDNAFQPGATMFRGNPAHTGEYPGPGPVDEPPLLWTRSTHGEMSTTAVVGNGVVYVGRFSGGFFAIDAITGDSIWETGLWANGVNSMTFSSAAYADGVVYVGGNDDFSGNAIFAYDAATGDQLWSSPTGFMAVSSPTVVDGVVYVGSYDTNVYAIDARDGGPLWTFPTGDTVDSSPAVVDGVVYVGSEDGNLYAIDAGSGQERWRFTTESGIASSPAVVDGVVYVGSYDGNLYAIDAATGYQNWSFGTEGGIGSSPAVVDGVVYIGSNDDNVYAIDAETGDELWTYSTGDFVLSSPAVVNGIVYIGSGDGYLYALDADSGEERWSYRTGDGIESSPAVVGGVIYIGSNDGSLYALGDPYSAGSTSDSSGDDSSGSDSSYSDAQATRTALLDAWPPYFVDISQAMMESSARPDILTVWGPGSDILIPIRSYRWWQGASYRLTIPSQPNQPIAFGYLLAYPSKEEADADYAELIDGLRRSGWSIEKVDDIDHNHTCLTLTAPDHTEAICLVTRDETLLVGDSSLPVLNSSDAVLSNAADVARMLNDAYDSTDQPEITPPANVDAV